MRQKPDIQAKAPTGRARRLLTDENYRRRLFVLATHQELFSVAEIARILGVARPTVYQDVKDVLSPEFMEGVK